jgi:hypothetical protein
MFLVSKSEMLHRREHLAERIENLCHGRDLPVEVPAVDIYEKGTHLGPTGIHRHKDSLLVELEFGTVEPEVLCCVHKLQETWDRKCELVEKDNLKLLEARGGDPMNECFQVSANTGEQEPVKVREYDGSHDWRMRGLHITVGSREFKADHEHLQPGHERGPLEQSIWMKVGGWVDHVKIECDEAHGSRE